MKSPPHVAILLATLNGEEFLPAQLASYRAQTHADWRVWASDDGSSDRTVEILREHPEAAVRRGPQRGSARNFLSLACDPEIQADYYAFSDQDDVWEPDKLAAAVRWLALRPRDVPALFSSRAQFIDRSGAAGELTPHFPQPAGFRNALVQNICSGNTMVFNNAARRLLMQAGPETDVVVHDWWAYLLVSGAGGEVHHSPEPLVRHRRHEHNEIFRSRGVRVSGAKAVLEGQFGMWIARNLRALDSARHLLSEENRGVFDDFAAAHSSRGLRKLWSLRRAGVYRQSKFETAGLMVSGLLGRW